MGRPRKPNAQKEVKGRKPGHDAAGRPLPEEPSYSSDIPKPPPILKSEGLREWKRLAPKMSKEGVLTEADWAIFLQYCTAISRRFQLQRAMNRKTMKIGSKEWLDLDRAYDRNEKILTKAITELGLSPVTRSKAAKTPKWMKEPEAADPAQKFSRSNLRAIKGGRK